MKRSYDEVHGRREADKSYLPISIDMILGFRDNYWKPRNLSLRQLTVITAMLFGYSTLSRKSEYLINPPNSDFPNLLANDISFTIQVDGVEVIVPSFQLASIPLSEVTGCHIIIRKAKNDPHGKGHKYIFPRRPVVRGVRLYDITTTLWEYVVRVRPASGHLFFFVAAEDWVLCPNYFNEQLKLLANFYKFDSKRVSSHSLRVGGASALMAAGVPEYLIKEMGGWRSLAFLLYLRATVQSFSDAQDVLTNADLFSVEKVRAMHMAFG